MWHFLFETIFGGLFLLLIGLYKLYRSIKKKEVDWEKEGALQPHISGIFGAIGLIVLGLSIIFSRH